MTRPNSALIIGGGLGGLFTAALLARNGVEVTIVEKNSTVGGGLQSFSRFGETFDTGMHIVGGLGPNGNVRRILRYIGIEDKIDVVDVDPDCSDELFFSCDGQSYRLATGREAYVNRLIEYFPDEAEGIRRYVNDIYAIADKVDLFNLRPSEGFVNAFTDDMLESADAFIARHVADTRLRALLAALNPLYGGRRDQTPAYVHALIQVLYINGASRFRGGSAKLAEALAEFIRQKGGKVITSDGVEHIEVDDSRRVTSVKTRSGLQLSADVYVSAIHPCTLFTIIDERAFPKPYRSRLNSLPNAYSAFALYIKFRPESFPYINHSVFGCNSYDRIWDFGNEGETWPEGFLFMTPPHDGDDRWARTGLVTAPMSFDACHRWIDTAVGRRGEDYETWKEECAKALLDRLEAIYPGFNAAVDRVATSSPLTIRDYYGSKEGCISGFSKDYKNIIASQVPVATKVANLFLTGQCVNLHGFCGVPLTAITTAEALLGHSSILPYI